MAERKGGQGELVGGEDGEERREGESVGRWVEDSGTESGEERKGIEEAVEEVKGALERLASALPRLAGNLGGSVNDLVTKLQSCLSAPAPPPRRNKRRHHTVGVTAEEIARARKWAERPHPLQLTRGEFKPLEYKAGYFIEPQPQSATVSYNSPTASTAPPINYDPSASLFTPAQSVQIAVHKAAIQKQISQEETKIRKLSLQRQMSQEELRKKESESESSSDEETSPAKRLLKIASKRRTRISKIKRSNTVEIARPTIYCDSDTDDPAYSSDRSDLKRKSCGSLYGQPPPFLPKTDNDLKFLDFLHKVNDEASKVISYNPSARGGKHWSNRFSRIKTAFEDQSSDEKEKEIIPKGKCSPFPQQKNYVQPKLPWSVKQEGDVVVGSITVAKKAPGPVNQFTHAPMSAFKPVEKKTFPSSVSGSVKQLVSQKFAPQSPPEIIKPVPSVPPRTHSKFHPLPGPEPCPLSQRFVPNKVSATQQHPPVQSYFNQYANYSPKHVTYPNDKIPFKTPNRNIEPKQETPSEYNSSQPSNPSSDFSNQQSNIDYNQRKNHHNQQLPKSKPEPPAKPVIKLSKQPIDKSSKHDSNYNKTVQNVSTYNLSYENSSKPITDFDQPVKSPLTDNNKQTTKPILSYNQPIMQTSDPNRLDHSNYSSFQDQKPKRESPKPMPNFNLTSKSSHEPSENSLTTDYNSNWASQDFNHSKDSLSVPNENDRKSESLSPHPYKGCYVYNENNEILSTSPYLPSNKQISYHIPISPSCREPIYQNISEAQNSSHYIYPSDLPMPSPPVQQDNNTLSVNGLKMPDISPLPHQFTESGTFYPRDQSHNKHPLIHEPLPSQRTVSSSPKYDSANYYNQGSHTFEPLNSLNQSYHQQSNGNESKNISNYYPDYKKASHDGINDLTHQGNFSPDNMEKISPYVVYNNCASGKKDSNEFMDRFSPRFDANSRGDSPRDCEEWDDCVEEKAVVGRVMGEAQCQRAVTKGRRVETRFPNAPSISNLLKPLVDQAKVPSPTLKPRQDHSPKAVSPSFPNVLHKSESWHQMVKEQMIQAKQAPPIPAKVAKTKSSHTLALPKQFEGALNPDSAQRLRHTVSQYMSKSPSSQKSSLRSQSENLLNIAEDIDNVDEAFESLFQECNKKRNSK